MRDYEAACRALDNKERAIDEELRKPGLTPEQRESLEAKKREVRILRRKLYEEKNGDGGREYETGKQPVKEAADDKTASETNGLKDVQARQNKIAERNNHEQFAQKMAERQMD